MTDLDSKLAGFYALEPARYGVVKSITMAQSVDSASGEMQQQVLIVLAKNEQFQAPLLYLELIGVRNLRLMQPEWSLVVLPNLEITQALLPNAHGGRFMVCDAEQGNVISCVCNDFIADIA